MGKRRFARPERTMNAIEQQGPWAIVTGASSGIGAQFARVLAQRGYRILAVARRAPKLEALASEIGARGGHVEPFSADLATEAGVRAVAERAERLGEIGFLVNSAGIAEFGAFLELTPEQSQHLLRLNIEALVGLTRRIAPLIVKHGSGGVVNVASGMALQAVPYFAVYAATKAFVLSFTDALAAELAGTGVQVQALCPGATRTEFGQDPAVERALAKFPSGTAEEVVRSSMRAYDRKRVVVLVGLFTGLMGLLARITPRSVNRWVGRRLLAPARTPASAIAT
jgi:short-subunit dehydrogenase